MITINLKDILKPYEHKDIDVLVDIEYCLQLLLNGGASKVEITNVLKTLR